MNSRCSSGWPQTHGLLSSGPGLLWLTVISICVPVQGRMCVTGAIAHMGRSEYNLQVLSSTIWVPGMELSHRLICWASSSVPAFPLQSNTDFSHNEVSVLADPAAATTFWAGDTARLTLSPKLTTGFPRHHRSLSPL